MADNSSGKTRGWILVIVGVLLIALTPVWFMLSAGWGLSGHTWAEPFYLVMLALGIAGLVWGIVDLVRARR